MIFFLVMQLIFLAFSNKFFTILPPCLLSIKNYSNFSINKFSQSQFQLENFHGKKKKSFLISEISAGCHQCCSFSLFMYSSLEINSGLYSFCRYYLSHNTALVKLLKKLGSRPIPTWLKNELSTSTWDDVTMECQWLAKIRR